LSHYTETCDSLAQFAALGIP